MFKRARDIADKAMSKMAKDVQGKLNDGFKTAIDEFYNSPNPYQHGANERPGGGTEWQAQITRRKVRKEWGVSSRSLTSPKYYQRGYNMYDIAGRDGAKIYNGGNDKSVGRVVEIKFDSDNMNANYKGLLDPETGNLLGRRSKKFYRAAVPIAEESIYKMDFMLGYHGGVKVFAPVWFSNGSGILTSSPETRMYFKFEKGQVVGVWGLNPPTRPNIWRSQAPYEKLTGRRGTYERAFSNNKLNEMFQKYASEIEDAFVEEVAEYLFGEGGK